MKLAKEDIFILREKFIRDYSMTKGWDYNSLTTRQMMEIVNCNDFINPKTINK